MRRRQYSRRSLSVVSSGIAVRQPSAVSIFSLDPRCCRLADVEVQHALDRPVYPRAQVVDLARRAALEQRPVTPHDVAHVREVAPGLQVAHQYDRLAEARLDLGDLLREVRGREGFSSTA